MRDAFLSANAVYEYSGLGQSLPDCHVQLVDVLPTAAPKPAKPNKVNLSDSLVTIATYNYPLEAHLSKAKLESEGIDSVVADEHIITTNWLYLVAVGGVKLQVRKSDARKALRILRSIPASIPEGTETSGEGVAAERCPNCHSVDIRYEMFNLRAIFILWFVFALLGISSPSNASFTLPVLKKKWKCHHCGYEWKEKKA